MGFGVLARLQKGSQFKVPLTNATGELAGSERRLGVQDARPMPRR